MIVHSTRGRWTITLHVAQYFFPFPPPKQNLPLSLSLPPPPPKQKLKKWGTYLLAFVSIALDSVELSTASTTPTSPPYGIGDQPPILPPSALPQLSIKRSDKSNKCQNWREAKYAPLALFFSIL